MKPCVVIDNSIVMRWFHPSGSKKNLARAERYLGLLEDNQFVPTAPVILTMELPNVLFRLLRIGELKGQVDTALTLWKNLEFDIIGSEFGSALYVQSLSELCKEHALSAYDAAYLELAIRIDCPLLTLDKALEKAAVKMGVDTDISNGVRVADRSKVPE